MRINLDLLREILKDVADHDGSCDLGSNNLIYDGISKETANHHIRILIDEGYLKAIDASDKLGLCYLVIELTMSGQSFFDKIENDTIWQKTKAIIANGATITGIASIEALVSSIVEDALK